MRIKSKSVPLYSTFTVLAFFLGLMPFIFNVIVDPYELHDFFQININKQKISEKAHYPLWKINHYPGNETDIIILGDSRARALRDKYWHELGLKGAYNFAYGGATIYEIYDTFHLIKTNPNLKKIVVGIQLRSFDESHKGGLNRVPEAIRLNQNSLQYYSNWFVSRIAMKNLEKKYKTKLSDLTLPRFQFVSSAGARSFTSDRKSLSDLLAPEVCNNCQLPQDILPTLHSSSFVGSSYYFGDGLGRWGALWRPITINRILPSKFKKQVRKNARSDWQAFHFSQKLWAYLIDISNWCRKNDVELVFVIPPTIVDMQKRITDFGYGDLNHEFRKNLTKLGPVLDFDFDNSVTRDIKRFTDAYHFDYKLSKLLVGEISQFLAMTQEATALSRKRRKDVICPILPTDEKNRIEDDNYLVSEGQACRIWRLK